MNLYDVFAETARRQPAQPALLGAGENDLLTYSALHDAVSLAAEGLQKAGLRCGDCAGLDCPSGADYIILTYALWKCGACVVPIPTELTSPEKAEICRQIALSHLVSIKRIPPFATPFLAGGAVAVGPHAAVMPLTPACQHPKGFHDINSAFIRFTSGTTGQSKGVVLSHETINERMCAANDVLHVGPDDRVLWLLSMSYHFAVSIVCYLSFGATVVLVPNNFAEAILAAAQRHRATLIYGSPAHYRWMASCEEGTPLPHLRLAISTTTALDGAAAAGFRRRFGVPLTQALGIIEIGLPFINVDFAADRSEAIGRLLPAYQMRLEDAGLGPDVKQLSLSGKGFLDAYYRPWRTRSQIMPDGWFHTGDVASVDADGCVFLRGRIKDVINVMGMKFFPQEVEAVLTSHPGVKDACVLPCPDPRLGEIPIARIIPADPPGHLSEGELREFCKQQLAEYKVPQRFEIVEDLWRTASGKVIHRDSTQRAAAERVTHGH
jgi:long-chain acyl-CoA synthetase